MAVYHMQLNVTSEQIDSPKEVFILMGIGYHIHQWFLELAERGREFLARLQKSYECSSCGYEGAKDRQ
jgi:hypothetical protein